MKTTTPEGGRRRSPQAPAEPMPNSVHAQLYAHRASMQTNGTTLVRGVRAVAGTPRGQALQRPQKPGAPVSIAPKLREVPPHQPSACGTRRPALCRSRGPRLRRVSTQTASLATSIGCRLGVASPSIARQSLHPPCPEAARLGRSPAHQRSGQSGGSSRRARKHPSRQLEALQRPPDEKLPSPWTPRRDAS